MLVSSESDGIVTYALPTSGPPLDEVLVVSETFPPPSAGDQEALRTLDQSSPLF